MSSSRALYCFPFLYKKKHLLDSGFYDIQNNEGLGKGYQPKPSASADKSYRNLDYSEYHKILIQ